MHGGSYYGARAQTNFAGTLGLMLPAMVLAAGLGTRLRPLTDECAKALVPVGDRPALGHVFERLRAAGVTRLVANAHHRAGDVRAFVAASQAILSEEDDLLGTAGGIARASDLLGDGPVLVCNADTLVDLDLRALVAPYETSGVDTHAALATLVVQPRAPGQGPVGIGEGGRIVRLRSERVGREDIGAEFLGISVLGADLRASLPPRGCLVGDVLIPALSAGALIRPYLHEGGFLEIGTPRSYLEANLAWLRGKGLTRWVAPGVVVDERVTLDEAVLGAGASATGRGTLARCVVWPGAHAVAPLSDAVVTRTRVVSIDLR